MYYLGHCSRCQSWAIAVFDMYKNFPFSMTDSSNLICAPIKSDAKLDLLYMNNYCWKGQKSNLQNEDGRDTYRKLGSIDWVNLWNRYLVFLVPFNNNCYMFHLMPTAEYRLAFCKQILPTFTVGVKIITFY